MTKPTSAPITVLGGGPAGLAVGYFAAKSGIPCTILEAAGQAGGNCATREHGEFRYDTGAHRFHDKDPEMTREILTLLGDDMRKVEAPSRIRSQGKFFDFPLTPLDLMLNLGLLDFTKAGFEVVAGKLRPKPTRPNFEEYALHAYGKTIATRFLLNYSQKLWGLPPSELSPTISGTRLKGLTLKTFFAEAVLGKLAKTRHLDGSFYYPRLGYGMITDKLAAACGPGAVRTQCRVTKARHDGKRIRAIGINHAETADVETVVSTLPLSVFLRMMEPAPPADILEDCARIRYRHLIVVGILLNRESVTDAATVYFPDLELPFTRLYEPRNRSPLMAPTGKTSLFMEIPCQAGDALWTAPDATLARQVRDFLIEDGWFKPGEVTDTIVERLPYAYPVLSMGFEDVVGRLFGWLDTFENLHWSGRNGRFCYTWMHDMLRFGKDIVDELSQRA